MMPLRRYHPALEHRLREAAEKGDGTALLAVLGSLSNADFRTAGYLLREKVLPAEAVARHFWELFSVVVPVHPKAYLGTFLRAAVTQLREGRILLDHERLSAFAAGCTAIDARKVLEALLPVMADPAGLATLLRLFVPADDDEAATALLVAVPTAPAGFELFRRLRRIEHRPECVRRCCLALMQRGDKQAFHLAALLQRYFGLEPLPGTFSLRLETYQLGRLDESYEKFLQILNNQL